MTIFILSEENGITRKDGTYEPGRAILDDQAHGRVIGRIEADPVISKTHVEGRVVEKIVKSAWCVAREKIDESRFYHDENKGWFFIESIRKARAA